MHGRLRQPRQTERPQGRFDRDDGHADARNGRFDQRYDQSGEGWTNKFIFSPYEFTVADAMVSNFHLPYSTQLMMVAAFGGYDCVMNAYKIAREEGYRFGTYGDAMLLL